MKRPERQRSADIGGTAVTAVLAVMFTAGATAQAGPACSVFDSQPCAPTVCSPFRDGPCIPEIEYPIGQELRLTIESVRPDRNSRAETPEDRAADREHFGASVEHRLDSIAALFRALRACWVPPALDEARPGLQMSVRLAFKRTGEIIGSPRVTYVTPETPGEVRERYHAAVTAALERCTPLPFTSGMGGAVAGRPIAIRFVDNRSRDDAASATAESSR